MWMDFDYIFTCYLFYVNVVRNGNVVYKMYMYVSNARHVVHEDI